MGARILARPPFWLLLAGALASCGLNEKGAGPGASGDPGAKGTLECVAFCHETHAVSGTSPVSTWAGGFHAALDTDAGITPAEAASVGCSSCHDPVAGFRWQGDGAMESAFREQERAYLTSVPGGVLGAPARPFIGCEACHGSASGHYLNGEGITAPAATFVFSYAGTLDRFLYRPAGAYTPGNPFARPWATVPCTCHSPETHAGALTAGSAGRYTGQYPEWKGGDGPGWTKRDGHSDSFAVRTHQGRMTSAKPAAPCVACHTVEGFVRFFARGDASFAASQAQIDRMVMETGDTGLAPPAQIPGKEALPQVSCVSCHPSHEPGNVLRGIGGDPSEASTVARLCFACHNMEGLAAPVSASQLNSVPWHAQKEMFLGVGGFEFAGFAYSSQESAHAGTLRLRRACATCHHRVVADAPGKTYPHRVTTGHSFRPRVDACTDAANGTCHIAADPSLVLVGSGGATDASAYAFSNPASYAFSLAKIPLSRDHDGDGQVEPLRAEIKGLLALLKARLAGNGAVWDNPDQVFDIGAMTALATTVRGAAWNYDFVATDRSFGFHNPIYTRNLLAASLSVLR
jgi:hypothetical protein